MQFVLLSDANATDFIGLSSVPIFRDTSSVLLAWREMQAGSTKHDTFVYAKSGERTLFWDASARDLAKWSTEIRAAVELLGR